MTGWPGVGARVEPASKLKEVTHIEQVAEFLKSQGTLTLATSAEDGTPFAAPLFYLADSRMGLYWLSSASSRHSRNLKRQAEAAVSVCAPTEDWKQIRGVQMRGHVTVVAARSGRLEIVEAYCARFQLGPSFQAAITRSRLYRFQPQWVRYLDNSKRFGYKFEFAVNSNGE